MVIDLTQDSDPEDAKPPPRTQPKFEPPKPFLGFLPPPQSSVPRKRKPDDSIESVSIKSASSDAGCLPNGTNSNGVSTANPLPSTPSPTPSSKEKLQAVVIPSPSEQLKRQIDAAAWSDPQFKRLTALSETHFPTDAFDIRALRGAYPAAKTVDRSQVPFAIGRAGPILTKRPAVNDQLRKTLQRKLSKLQGPPVTFASTDERALQRFAANFEFVNGYKLRNGVKPESAEFDGGCSCGPICDPDRCLCLDSDVDSDDEDRYDSTAPAPKIVPYQRAPDSDDLVVLTPDFLKRTARIPECGAHCACDHHCWNRVVQRGRTVRLEIFDTLTRGFGLRSPDPIRAGQFIDCYRGEVVTKEVANVREEVAVRAGQSYLFDLDFSPAVDEDDIYVVDGQRYGSPTRFMNHSCNPNCRMFPVSHTHADQKLYDLAFFALRDIPPMTELTFDYNPGGAGAGPVKPAVEVDPHAVRCLCGEKNCRGQLWPNQRKGTK
ncbi:hypothetical protein BDV59DRAFT_201344 [Aspergillus ambiguus]|uniref:histone-lysine N-methyltransferase Clr4 n=1 Tax=Aspergillus ambiguus TaxID=176160 RepID=UPI003CCCDD1F